MLRDQVRRSKKKVTPSVTQRPVRVRAGSSPSRESRSRLNVVVILVIPLLLLATLWYGCTHILSYVLLTPTPRLTLLIHAETESGNVQPAIWLLVEGKKSGPRYFSLAARSELTTGMAPGLTVSTLATALTETITPQTARTWVSQSLGLPIDEVVEIHTSEDNWRAVVAELRQNALSAMRAGALTNQSLRLWLVARLSEGDTEPLAIASITNQLSRQNLEPIITQENCPVAVLNNSGKAGFATLVGKIIEQSGGTVLRIANALPVGESASLTNPTAQVGLHPGEIKNCAGTIAAISKLLPELQVSENQTLAEQYRSSVVLLLGPEAQIELDSQPATGDVPDPRL